MIKILQKKFIKTAMLAITVLLVAFVVAINAVNVVIASREIDKSIDILAELGAGTPPKIEQLEPKKYGFHKFFSAMPDEERAMAARYFSFQVNERGEIVQMNVDNIATITYDEAEEIAARIILSGNSEGSVDGFKFKAINSRNAQGQAVVCVDTFESRRGVITVAVTSVTVGIVCWLAMLLFVSLLSKRAIKPIAENIEKQRRFVTDAGHEIKTPLAIILANTDALVLHNGESKWSNNIRNQITRLNGLMQNLLTLSRSDEAQAQLVKEEIDASKMLTDTLESFKPLAETQNKKILIEAEENISVLANGESLCQLFNALVDNAVKYSSDCSEISVSLKRENDKAVFAVQNVCDGLPACEPEKLFDRFYRADESRGRESGGYGIGLSVVKAIADNHKWKIKAEYFAGNIIKFTVIFNH